MRIRSIDRSSSPHFEVLKGKGVEKFTLAFISGEPQRRIAATDCDFSGHIYSPPVWP
jgi:hypothetical protein